VKGDGVATGSRVGRAILLSAGKGSRLLPLTADRPKCLLEFSGRSLLEWQLDALFEAGIGEMFVVTGFRSDLVEAVIAARGSARGKVSTIFNPFYHVADNLGSAWLARSAMDRPFLLLNGDTLVPPALVTRLLDAPGAPITVAVDRKAEYDSDDMKVLCDGDHVLRIDKKLTEMNAESIGFLRFFDEGAAAFVDTAEQILRAADGTRHFFLAAVDRLARTGIVTAASIQGLDWAEVDCPDDLEIARRLTGRWAAGWSAEGRPLRAEPSA
jgi:choline kinase